MPPRLPRFPAHTHLTALPTLTRPTLRTSPYQPRSHAQIRSFIYLPTILAPSFWASLLPRRFRRSSPSPSPSPSSTPSSTTPLNPHRKKAWNPATYFIILSLLIGSQAIQTITLHTEFAKFSLETETKLRLLRDVVDRLRRGEDVDVEGELGTGEEKREREWEDVVRELEAEDAMFRAQREKLRARGEAELAELAEAEARKAKG